MPKAEPFPNDNRDVGSVDEGTLSGRGVKVVVATPAHPTYADVRVFQKEARTLAAHGYEVTLFAQAEGRVEPFVEEGVRVVPLKYSSRRHMTLSLPRLARRLLREDADIYHLHNPFSLPLVLALKAAGRTVIYDVHEDFRRRVHIRPWIPRKLRPAMGRGVWMLERLVGRAADATISTQEDVLDRLGPKAVLIDNAPLTDGSLMDIARTVAASLSDEQIRPGGALRLIYAGGISESRGLFSMVRAVQLVNQKRPARLWLLGSCDPNDLLKAQAMDGWTAVDYLGPRSQHEAFGYIAASDVGLAVLLNRGGHSAISSNKLYEYMALETPFVASNFPAWQSRLPRGAGGLFVDPEDEEAIAEAILRFEPGSDETREVVRRGHAFVTEHFNWELEGQKLLALYAKLLGQR